MPGKDNHMRRKHERIRVQPMYTSVIAKAGGTSDDLEMLGHVYDVSEGGVRIELDEALEPGQTVTVQLEFPGTAAAIEASAKVVWVHDDLDDPGPRRMALRFTEFTSAPDRDRLVDYIDRERGRRAA